MDNESLFAGALLEAGRAYAPYSGFCVGAALLTTDGKVYYGSNIENASYPAGICAERTAIFKAVSEGKRSFTKIAVAGVKNGEVQPFVTPCGICRQVMSEFCSGDFEIITGDGKLVKVYKLSELLPAGFAFGQTDERHSV